MNLSMVSCKGFSKSRADFVEWIVAMLSTILRFAMYLQGHRIKSLGASERTATKQPLIA